MAVALLRQQKDFGVLLWFVTAVLKMSDVCPVDDCCEKSFKVVIQHFICLNQCYKQVSAVFVPCEHRYPSEGIVWLL